MKYSITLYLFFKFLFEIELLHTKWITNFLNASQNLNAHYKLDSNDFFFVSSFMKIKTHIDEISTLVTYAHAQLKR